MTTTASDRAAVRMMQLRPPRELTAQREEWLVQGLAGELPSLRMRELFALRRDMFRSADLITVAVDGGTGVAVGALSARQERLPGGEALLNVTTQFVSEARRHAFVFRSSWGAHFRARGYTPDTFPRLIALKTYNPVVWCGLRTFTRIPGTALYPDCSGAPQDRGRMESAARVAAVLAPGHPFEPRTGVIAGVGVPKDLYPSMPQCRNASANAYFARTTRPGDRVLCVFDVGSPQAAAALLAAFHAETADLREAR
jgi:hypothetical protein